MASESDQWVSDSSDWLSESVHDEDIQQRLVTSPTRPTYEDGLGDQQPATINPNRPRLFDEPLDALEGQRVEDAIDDQSISDQFGEDRLTDGKSNDDAQGSDDESAGDAESAGGVGAAISAAPSPKTRSGKRQKQKASSRRRRRKQYRRIRLFPRSVIGISMLILAAGLGAAVSGTVLYMRYEFRKDLADANIKGFDKRVKLSTEAVIAEGQNAQARIQTELDPLLKQAATGDTLIRILNAAKDSIVTVSTFNEAGEPVLGTAFVAASDAEKTFLVTSYNVVRAGVVRPGPEITVRSGSTDYKATLWTWQAEKDLALLIINKGGLPRLEWAETQDTRLGSQVFAISGLGTNGGAITSGFVADVSSSGIQHSAPLGTAFQGGPIVNDRGKVVAVGSRTFAPLGFPSDSVWFAPLIRSACEQLLKCPQGQVTGAGTQR